MSAIFGIIDYQQTENAYAIDSVQTEYRNRYRFDTLTTRHSGKVSFGCGIQTICKSSGIAEIIEDDEVLFTADCHVDNRERLITETKSPDGTTDIALMYACFRKWGDSFVSYIHGVYSVAIYSKKKEELCLISDPVSARCLYYYKDARYTLFSTALAPLKHVLPDFSRNENYYKDFLMADSSLNYVVPGETPVKDVFLMRPGRIVTIQASCIRSRSYYTPISENKTDLDETAFMDCYKNAVTGCLTDTLPVGIALSGGLDSCSIAAIAHQALMPGSNDSEYDTNEATHAGILQAYTIVPALPSSAHNTDITDESNLIAELCRMYPGITPHFLCNGGRNTFDDRIACTQLLEMPYKTMAIPNYMEIAKEAAKSGCKVLLTGIYGNNSSSFGQIYHILYDMYIHGEHESFLRNLHAYCNHENLDFVQTLGHYKREFDALRRTAFALDPALFRTDYLQKYVPQNPFLYKSILDNYDFADRFSTCPAFIYSNMLIDRTAHSYYLYNESLLMFLGVFETKVGLQSGLLLRDPTKDRALLSMCGMLPYSFFARNGIPRYLLRGLFHDLLPASITENYNSRGLQNADRIQRVERDWPTLAPALLEYLSQELPPYIDTNGMKRLIQNMDFQDTHMRSQIKYLCAIYEILINF